MRLRTKLDHEFKLATHSPRLTLLVPGTSLDGSILSPSLSSHGTASVVRDGGAGGDGVGADGVGADGGEEAHGAWGEEQDGAEKDGELIDGGGGGDEDDSRSYSSFGDTSAGSSTTLESTTVASSESSGVNLLPEPLAEVPTRASTRVSTGKF